MDAPPDTHSRRLATSPALPPAWCRIAAYIVGTPGSTVTWSRLMISSARAGSNRVSSVRQAPVATAHPIPTTWPNEWNSGSAPKTTSAGSQVQQRRGW